MSEDLSKNIDLNDSNDSTDEQIIRTNGLSLIDRQSKQSIHSQIPQLCGYLNKLSSRGPLRAMKRRWFVFNQNNCKLYYYRTRDDLLPLGDIDIRRATFSIKTQSSDSQSSAKSSIFTIVSFDKEFTLEANDSNECLFWLKQLQLLRRNYIIGLAEDQFGLKLPENQFNSDLDFSTNQGSDGSRSVFYYDCEQTSSSSKCLNPRDASPPKIKNEDLVSLVTHSPATKQKIFGGIINKVRKNPENVRKPETISSPIRALLKLDKSDANCLKCKETEEQLVSLSDDLSAIENELQASREVIKLLQQQLEIVNNEKKLLEDICKSDTKLTSNDYLSILTKNNEEMTKLKIELRQSDTNRDSAKNENENLKSEINRLKDEVSVLQEMLQSRDETVVDLTHKIFNLESEKAPINKSVNNDFMNFNLTKQEMSEFENLKDTVRAFETQNEFLNKEIVELNELRNVVEMKEKESQLRICELEAKCCQVQSKLLSLLKEINQSSQTLLNTNDQNLENKVIAANESVQILVNRLLDETSLDIPLSWRPGNKARTASNVSSKSSDFDDLGFYYKTDTEYSDNLDILASKVEKIRIKNEEIRDKQNETKSNALWKAKWDSYVGNLNNHEFQRSQELKSMLRTGIPQEYRCKIWKGIIYMRVKNKYNECGPNYYQTVLKQNPSTGTKCDPSAKQIELDLLRTLPNNKHFESLESDGTCRLRRVLTAFSRHNRAVGYCQGLNRLAAVALLFMPEEDAFWCLVAIVETIMPNDYFGRNLLGAHVDQYVLKHLVAEKLPKLHYHLEQHGIELSLFSWFLTAFVDNIPVNVYLRIWDVFLYEGNKVLFRFALSFLKLHEEEILKMNDSVSINQFLRTLGERECDVKQLCNIAFCQLNPFPYRTVKLKRQHYSYLVKNELEKLEEIRKSLPNHDRSFDCESD